MLIGYARVSKGDEQSNKAQARALSEAGCARVFEEKASGGRWDRPPTAPHARSVARRQHHGRLEAGSPVAFVERRPASDGSYHQRGSRVPVPHRGDRHNRGGRVHDGADGGILCGVPTRHDPGEHHDRTRSGACRRTNWRRRKKLGPKTRREIAESVLTGRKSGAEIARLYDISERTVSRIVTDIARIWRPLCRPAMTSKV